MLTRNPGPATARATPGTLAAPREGDLFSVSLDLPADQKTRYYFMRDNFVLDGRDTSLDAVIYDRLKEKEQTMLDAIDGGYLEDGYLDEEDERIIFERLLGGRGAQKGTNL